MRNPRERIRNSRGYKWWILSLVMLGTFMAVMDVTVVNVGLPTIMSVFHIPISTAEWVITAYMITMTLMLPARSRSFLVLFTIFPPFGLIIAG